MADPCGGEQVTRPAGKGFQRVRGGHLPRRYGSARDVGIVAGAATDADTVTAYLSAFEQAGADEVIRFPVSSDPGQVELLAQVTRSQAGAPT